MAVKAVNKGAIAVVDKDVVDQNGAVLNCAFSRKGVTAIEFAMPITKIGSHAFRECTKITKVVIPEGVTEIDTCAFDGCSSLKEVILPSTLRSIETMAFAHCTSLKRIVFPNRVSKIGMYAFEGCVALNKIEFDEEPIHRENHNTEDNGLLTVLEGAFGYCDALKTVAFPDRMKAFAANACFGKKLETIIFPADAKFVRGDYLDLAAPNVQVFFRMWTVVKTVNGIPKQSNAYITKSFAQYAMNEDFQLASENAYFDDECMIEEYCAAVILNDGMHTLSEMTDSDKVVCNSDHCPQ